ncbi:MAG: RidA family protein [Acidimicrobiales bacterium]
MSFEPVIPAGTESATERFHFSAATRVGDLVLCSGQIGTGDDGVVPDDPAEDFRNAWRKVGEVLDAVGLGYGDIAEMTTFHVGLQEHLGTFLMVRDEFLTAPWPAWTAIGVAELAAPGARVEIKVTAVAP